MTGEIRNPVNFLSLLPLLPAEKEFARCLAEGECCIVGDEELPKKGIESGEGANMVRGEVIRFFAYGGNEENPVLGPVIYLQGAWVSGGVNLSYASIPYALMLSKCHFDAFVMILLAECAGLYFSGSRLAQGLDADGLMTKGGVHLRDGFSAEGEVRLLGANIGGGLDCGGGKFHNPGGNALSADRLTTKDIVSFQDGFSAEGEVRLSGASIGGDLDCTGGKFHNPDKYALNADGLTAKGSVSFQNGFSAEGEVRLLGANIGENLNCMGGRFNNSDGDALLADSLTTKGSVNLSEGFSAEGEVRLVGANIGGELDCVGGQFNNSDGKAFSADSLTTRGDVNLSEGFFAKGEVRFVGANIGGDLSCASGKFHNLGGKALHVDKLTTKGNVNLRDGFCAEGETRLLSANIGGNFICVGGQFNNSDGDALSADGLTTKGNVNLSESFSAKGKVRLGGVNIGRNLDCVGGKFHNLDGDALSVEGGNINGSLFWWNITCEGNVNLTYARANLLADNSNSWKSCKVALDGFTYNRFANFMNAQFRIDWLAKRPNRVKFSPLPYEQAAKILFGMGHAHDARKILLEKERLQTKEEEMHWLRKFGRRLWDVFAGYGYRLRYTAVWMAVFVALGAVIFGAADWHSNIVPTHPVVALSDGYKMQVVPNGDMRPTQAAPPEYPAFNPLMFSLDVFTPSAVFHQEDSWGPRSGGGDWKDFDVDILWLLTLWYWVEVAMGWILTSMLLLSVTGLLRPRQSTGERD